MKRLLFLLLLAPLLLLPTAHEAPRAQQQPIYCQKTTTNTPCNAITGPINTGNGDFPYQAFGKTNAMFGQVYGMFGSASNFYLNGVLLPSDVANIFTGCNAGAPALGYLGTCISVGGGGGGSTFQVNATAATSQNPINFENSATAPLTVTVANPSAGNIQFSVAGLPSLITGDYLTNNGTTLSWGSPTGSGTVNSGSLNQFAVYASAGTAVSGATASACLAVGSGAVSIAAPINAQTGTTYTVQTTDACKLLTLNNASAVAVTLPQATGSFAAGFSFDVQNLGVGTVTITPTTSTINAAASLVVQSGYGCSITSDGTNYQVSACNALISNTAVSYILDEGTTFTASGTGACATRSTLTGGTAVGSAECTGTTGASTLTVTLPSATNSIWVCKGFDKTTTANTISQTAYTATSATLSGTVTANDVIAFACMGS